MLYVRHYFTSLRISMEGTGDADGINKETGIWQEKAGPGLEAENNVLQVSRAMVRGATRPLGMVREESAPH